MPKNSLSQAARLSIPPLVLSRGICSPRTASDSFRAGEGLRGFRLIIEGREVSAQTVCLAKEYLEDYAAGRYVQIRTHSCV